MNQTERKAFNSQFWRFLWSAILIALSGCLGNVVDAMIVGNLIGEDAVSAINLTRPVVQFMYTLNMLLATGAGILVGVEIGKKDMTRAAYFYTLSMAACLIVGLLLAAAGLFCPGTVTGWLCSNAHLFQLTFEYLSIMLIGAPAYMMMWALSTMVGVDGSPRLVSIAILIDNAVNLSLDIVFIQLLGWGISGSSAATIVGHVVGIVIMLWHFRYKDNHLRMLFSDVEIRLKKASSQIISQGAPLAIASVCLTLLLYNANSIVLGTLGRTGIFAFAVCMNLLQIYNLFLAGVCRTIQSLGAIQVGKGDNEAFRLVLRKSFSFITAAMILICVVVWVDPNVISRLFGANDPAILAESNHALRIFSLSFIPFCYIYAIMIVYKLYAHHRMALFISFALSLTVIPVLWLVSKFAPGLLWYSYLIAYIIEIVAILVLHHVMHAKFELLILFTVLVFAACTKPDRCEEADRVNDEVKELMFKNPEQALARVDSAEQAGEFSASDANLVRVNIYWNIGQKRMAAFYGEQALADSGMKRKSKTYYSALMLMVKWYEENGEYGKANEMADEILADVEKDTSQMALTMRSSALTRKAECKIHTGHTDEAERLYLECIDVLMKGMTHPKSYWEIDPLFYAILETSDFYLEHGKPEKALELITKGDTALARLERSPEVPDKVLQFRRNNVTISQAMVYAANGQRDKAEALYLKHRQTEGLSHTGIFVEGRYLAMTDRYDEAIRLYRQSDSIYRAAGGSLSSAYINARMSLEYDALQKAGRMAEALALGNRIRMLSDSVRIQERRADMEQQKEIKRQEVEIIDKRHALTVHRIILVAAILVCLLIAYLLWRSYQYNKVLAAKNLKLYEEIEQRRQEDQQEMAQLQATPEEQLTTDQQLFRRLCTLMDEQKPYTDETLNRDSLARLLGTNAKYVEQAIRQCSKGETPGDFITRYRLEHVARLLKTTDDPIAIIGELAGIPSRATLARLFRNAYGMSPSEYRKI